MAAVLDLSKIKVKDSKEPLESRRGRPAMENPFIDSGVITESYNNDQPKSVVVPLSGEMNKAGDTDKAVVTVLGLLNAAAEYAGLGVRTQIMEPDLNKMTQEIRFQGKERTTRTRREAADLAETG